MSYEDNEEFFKGRGAQINTHNKFLKNKYVLEHIEGLDEPMLENSATQLLKKHPKRSLANLTAPI